MESLSLANSKERSESDQFELVKLFAEGEDHLGSLKKTHVPSIPSTHSSSLLYSLFQFLM